MGVAIGGGRYLRNKVALGVAFGKIGEAGMQLRMGIKILIAVSGCSGLEEYVRNYLNFQ